MKKNYTYKVPDMSCGHCVKRITGLLESMGVTGFEISLEQKSIHSEEPLEGDVLEALDKAGYPVTAS